MSSKRCSKLVMNVGGYAKEVYDITDDGYSVEDITANNACTYWESWIPGASVVGGLVRESCEDCCARKYPPKVIWV